MPKVSVIIPAYNAANYIEATLSSVQCQTFKDWECLVVDDCSQDATGDICRQYALTDTRFKYILQKKNGGPAIARNTGMDLAQGTFLAFLDSDDIYQPSFLEKMLSAADACQADVVWCNYCERVGASQMDRFHGLPVYTPLPEMDALQLFFRDQVGLGNMWNKIYRRSLIERHRIRINPSRFHGEDWEFNLHVFQQHPSIVAIPDVLHHYIRQNTQSVVATYHPVDWDNHVRSYQLLQALSQKRGIAYDLVQQNTRFIYITLAFLVALCHSALPGKQQEFQRIVTDPFFRKLVQSTAYQTSRLPVRFQIFFALIRFKLYRLCRMCMSLNLLILLIL